VSSDDEEVARDLHARDIIAGLNELRDILMRLEALMTQIALGMGMRPHG
jgi:hypothetical protein